MMKFYLKKEFKIQILLFLIRALNEHEIKLSNGKTRLKIEEIKAFNHATESTLLYRVIYTPSAILHSFN